MKRFLGIMGLLLLLLQNPVAAQESNAMIYQGSTIEALLAGNYDGVASVEDILSKGDTGLGTFAGLDGEMIVLGGKVYKAAKDGSVTVQSDAAQSPFYAVSSFKSSEKVALQGSGYDYAELKAKLDLLRKRTDLPHLIVLSGKFAAVKVRSAGPFSRPFPLLSAALQSQSVYEYENLSGVLVGFWLPAYLGNTNASGYHLHFISDDRSKGGHLLELRLLEGDVRIEAKQGLQIEFAPYQTTPLLQSDAYKS